MSSSQPTAPEDDDRAMPIRLDFTKMAFSVHQGITLPYLYNPPEIQMQKVKDMDIRDTDILLYSYPRSGTHWHFRVIDMLLTGKAEYGSRDLKHSFIELQPIDRVNNLPSPRILTSHLPHDLLPDQVKDGKIKVVHVYRYPKAVMASVLCFLSYWQPDVTIDQLAEKAFSSTGLYGSQFYHFDKTKEFQQIYPNVSLYNVAYEDMKKDPVGSIQKLAAFLQTDTSDQLCSQIAEAVTFSRQKEEEERNADEVCLNVNFFRKGQILDWKNHLTVAISERIDQVLADRAHHCPFSARYVPSN